MSITVLVTIYCVAVVCASMFGGLLPSLIRLTHTRMQLAMSFVSGLMLGVGLLHMIPHAYHEIAHEGGSLDVVVGMTVVGLLTMFFMIRLFHFHDHSAPQDSEADDQRHNHLEEECDDYDHNHSHDHCPAHKDHAHKLSWLGIAIGLALHTMIDGIALASAVVAEAHGEMIVTAAAGAGVFLAIALHKPLDALSITTLMIASGWSARGRLLVNAGFAMMCPLGVLIFHLYLRQFEDQHYVVGCALAFSGGVFLCISLSDLLPEVQFHSHDRGKLSLALLLGVAIAYGIGHLPGHQHLHETKPQQETEHDHSGHQHHQH